MAVSAKFSIKQPAAKKRLKQSLLALGSLTWQEKPEQHCDYRLDGKLGGDWLRVKQFTNGTVYVEASNADLLAQAEQLISPGSGGQVNVITPQSGVKSVSQSPTQKSSGLLNITGDYIGTDESGKGDYFGPLVVAGVVVTEKTIPILKELGVMDSKKLTDAAMRGLSQDILDVVGTDCVGIVEIGPKKYNELYERLKSQGKNLNHLLAWGHATVIEGLLEKQPGCKQVIADQFGNESYIRSQLKEKGKLVTLHQTHRAEANVGVAAASIIARVRFVQKVEALSHRFGVSLSLGANPKVKNQARAVIEKHGRPALAEVAKLHFKTTAEL